MVKGSLPKGALALAYVFPFLTSVTLFYHPHLSP